MTTNRTVEDAMKQDESLAYSAGSLYADGSNDGDRPLLPPFGKRSMHWLLFRSQTEGSGR